MIYRIEVELKGELADAPITIARVQRAFALGFPYALGCDIDVQSVAVVRPEKRRGK